VRFRSGRLARLAVLAGLSLLCADAAAEDRFEPIREIIRKAVSRQRPPSLAVGVSQGRKILWEEAFGWADISRGVRATAHTLYSLASVSKPVTATAVMVLAERGKLELDRPVNGYLGEAKLRGFPSELDKATVRRVLSHTAGLGLHYHFFPEDEDYPRPPMAVTIRRYGFLAFRPGESYYYSNLGYGILDHLIERVSGKPFPDFLRAEVFEPLGLAEMDVPVRWNPEANWARRYWDPETPLPFYDFDHRGASAVFASVHDLIRFAMFHLGVKAPGQERILQKKTVRGMQHPEADVPEGGHYGLGWRIVRHASGHRLVQHSGGMAGVRTHLVLVPRRKIVVAALANGHSGLPFEVTGKVLEELLGRVPLNRNLAAGTAPTATGPPDSNGGKKTKIPSDLRGRWSGHVRTYVKRLPMTLWLRDPEQARVRLGDQASRPLRALGFEDGFLTARFLGDIGTPDANRRRYFIALRLKLRGDVLNGSATAVGLPTPRLRNALGSWVELRRAEAASKTRAER